MAGHWNKTTNMNTFRCHKLLLLLDNEGKYLTEK